VTAVVRGDGGFAPAATLNVVRADATVAADLEPLLVKADAVISALGHRKGDSGTVQGDGAAAAVSAAPAGTRALFVGASAMYSDSGDGPLIRWLAKPLLRRVLRASYADTARMESLVAESDLDWTFVRPSRLTDGARTGRYRKSVDLNLRRGNVISRADVAAALLSLAEDEATVRHAVYVAY
jgi:putative NADH-flavin reductase